MDPALMKELNAFKKKSAAQPVVEARERKTPVSQDGPKPRKKRKAELPAQLLQQAKKQAMAQSFDYKSHAQIRTKSRFSILSSIVDYLKGIYQNKNVESLSLEDLLDKTNNTDIKLPDKQWLEEALKDNPKIYFNNDKYTFKPKYHLKDKKSLIRLLEKHDQNGLGGILLDDIREGLPNADDTIKAISSKVIFVTRVTDKKAVLFHYDSAHSCTVDEEFQKHWRSVAVDGLGEPDIERYLNKMGIATMQGVLPASKRPDKKRGGNKKRRNMKLLNNHLDGTVLKDYSDTK